MAYPFFVEGRRPMPFDIAFDYRFAEDSFFDDGVRTVLEAAAAVWEGLIGEEFDDVPAGVGLTVRNPGAPAAFEHVELDSAIDDVRIFVGAHAPPFGIGGADSHALARARVEGQSARGDAFAARIGEDFRGNGPVTDFEPFAGSLSINPDPDWGLDPAQPAADRMDLFTVVLHEIGHVLGLGTSPTFQAQVGPDGFTGPNATAERDGAPVPMTDQGHHPTGDTEALMAPTLAAGARTQPQALDKAMLADIGYAIDGFTAQGRTPALVTDGDDPLVKGTAVADTLNGGGGADHIQAGGGADNIAGGTGADTIFGQAGADTLAGGPGPDTLLGGRGDDTLAGGTGANALTGGAGADVFVLVPGADGTRVTDFDPATDTLLVDPAFGTDSAAELAARARPGGDGALTLALDADTTVHLESAGPLTAEGVELGRPGGATAPPSAFTAADDTVRVTPGESVAFDPLANDHAPGGRITAHSLPLRGDLEDAGANGLRFTAPADFAGSTPFSYRVGDGSGTADAATVRLTAAPDADGAAQPAAALTDLNPAAQITALSLAILGRAPAPADLAFWRAEMAHARAEGHAPGAVLDGIAESFRISPEAQAQSPALSADTGSLDQAGVARDAVEALYQTAFGRLPGDAAAADWGAQLAARMAEGMSVGDVFADVLAAAHNGPEHRDAAVLHNRIEIGLAAASAETPAPGNDAPVGAAPADVEAGRTSVELAVLGMGSGGASDDGMG